MNTGKLYIISAPSGAGKTSLVKQMAADLDDLLVSVSHTTRQQRPGEIHGRDYYFVSEEEFQAMLAQQDFLEYAQVFDHYYGTARQTVTENLNAGSDVILEIDWQGAWQIRKKMPECLSIFILPPSTAVLEQRLRKRGQDSELIISRRMQDAVAEMQHYDEYDYLLVNDDFDQALMQLKSIVISERLRKTRQKPALAALLAELLS